MRRTKPELQNIKTEMEDKLLRVKAEMEIEMKHLKSGVEEMK